MLDHRGGQTTRELTIEPDVVVRDHIAHLHFGDDREARFIHRAHPLVRVRIDEPRRDVLAGGVHDHRTSRRGELLPHAHDLARLHQQVGVLQPTLRSLRPHRRVAHQQHRRLRGRCRATELHGGPDERQVDLGHLHRHGAAGRAGEGFRARAAILGVGAVGKREPTKEGRVAHGARQQQRAFLPERLTGEGRFEATGLGDDTYRRERDRPAAGHFDGATNAIERAIQSQGGRLEGAGVVGGNGPRTARVDLRRTRNAVLTALHPHIAHARLFGEEIAFADHEVGDLPGRDGAVRLLDAQPRGRHGGQRRQGLVGREATRHRAA